MSPSSLGNCTLWCITICLVIPILSLWFLYNSLSKYLLVSCLFLAALDIGLISTLPSLTLAHVREGYWGQPERATLRGKCTDQMCDVRVCVCPRVHQNSESATASLSKFGVYVKVQRSTDSRRQKSGENSGCVIPGSSHCLLLGGPHRFLQLLLVARVLR